MAEYWFVPDVDGLISLFKPDLMRLTKLLANIVPIFTKYRYKARETKHALPCWQCHLNNLVKMGMRFIGQPSASIIAERIPQGTCSTCEEVLATEL